MRARRSRRCSPNRGRSTGRPRWRASTALSVPDANSAVWLSDGIADNERRARSLPISPSGAACAYLAAEPGQAPLLLGAGDVQANDLGVVVRSLPAPAPRLLSGACAAARTVACSLAKRRRSSPAPKLSECGWRCRASSETGRLASKSKATNRRARCCWSTSAGAAARSASPPRRIPAGSRCSARTTTSSARWVRSPRSAAAAPPISSKRQLAVLIFSDTGPDLPAEEAAVLKWIEAGGLLLRFAGPHLAEQSDQLLPVRLRRGGRTIGGALSWEQPARLAPFTPDSPFAGLAVPGGRDRFASGAGRAGSGPRERRPGRAWPTARRSSPPTGADKA